MIRRNPRGDIHPIRIGAGSNIQDGGVIHAKSGTAVTVGRRTSIAHRSIIHGPCAVDATVFCEKGARTNVGLVQACGRIRNEF